ncbi:hypothetical protein KAR91_25615 [Candidatus Pacearchaeota archaeon]|nr:hypothetical protein [Candidatus Pacearchaeota archaeon]
MKIDKLYTLSQFIDLMDNAHFSDYAAKFILVEKYNKFLKQPLKKSMFVNEKIPPINYTSGEYDDFEEAEKKVIFKDLNYHNLLTDLFQLPINKEWYKLSEWTLNKLAERTNGELKLKNIEL